MKNIIYKVTYKPHLGTDLPKYYIGSKYNYKSAYFGSVASKQVFEFTEGMPLCEWWKSRNKEDLEFEVIEELSETAAPVDLTTREAELQEEMGVLGPDYFNQCIANAKFVSCPKSAASKEQVAKKTKAYWNSPAGLAKRKRLSARNRRIKSKQMKERWQNPTEAMLQRPTHGRPKGAKDKKPRIRRWRFRPE